jgi:hypothetical protein
LELGQVLLPEEQAGMTYQFTPRRHRTDSIDYAVVLAGEIDMKLDEKRSTWKREMSSSNAGRSTIGATVGLPCVIAFVLIGAKTATANGNPLPEVG